MDYKLLSEQYKLQLEAWYLFYQDFVEYDTHISNARGILVSMFSELNKVRKSNPNNPKLEDTKNRLTNLLDIVDKFESMATRCQNLKQMLRDKSANEFRLLEKIEKLENELKSIKDAHNQ